MTARACLLMETSGEELRQATAMVDRALAADPAKYGTFSRHFKFAKGLAEYRAGRFESAASIMAGDAAPVLGPAPKLVAAMAQYRLGKIDESRRTLDQAVRAFDWGGGYARISEVWMFHVRRREAEAMINPKPGRVP